MPAVLKTEHPPWYSYFYKTFIVSVLIPLRNESLPINLGAPPTVRSRDTFPSSVSLLRLRHTGPDLQVRLSRDLCPTDTNPTQPEDTRRRPSAHSPLTVPGRPFRSFRTLYIHQQVNSPVDVPVGPSVLTLGTRGSPETRERKKGGNYNIIDPTSRHPFLHDD